MRLAAVITTSAVFLISLHVRVFLHKAIRTVLGRTVRCQEA